MNGIITINKPANYTSRDVVNIVGKLLGTKKIGHTGTLDPMATGVMVLCIEKATKLVEVITSEKKEYVAQMILGIQTDTGDITGNILEEKEVSVTAEEIKQACKNMTTTYFQTVPIYSAVKIKGKKLYEYARNGETIELPKRKVTIYELECSKCMVQNQKVIIEIRTVVSKGTYIRSLIEDIASMCHTVGTMSQLTRTRQGEFSIEDCNTLEEIEQGNYHIEDYNRILQKYPTIVVDSYLENKIKNGVVLENRYQEDVVLFQNEQGVPLALYQIYEKDSTKMKPWKMLEISSK